MLLPEICAGATEWTELAVRRTRYRIMLLMPGQLSMDCIFKTQLLEPELDVVEVLRNRSVNRIPEYDDQPDGGNQLGDAFGAVRVIEILTGGFPCNSVMQAGSKWKVCSVLVGRRVRT